MIRIDLRPAEVKWRAARVRQLTYIAVTAFFVLGILTGDFVLTSGRLERAEMELNSTRAEHARYRWVVEKNEDLGYLMSELKTTREFIAAVEERQGYLMVVEAVDRVVPSKVELKAISCSSDNVVTVKGASSSLAEIGSFISELEQTGLFSGLSLKFDSNFSLGGGDPAEQAPAEFSISGKFSGSGGPGTK